MKLLYLLIFVLLYAKPIKINEDISQIKYLDNKHILVATKYMRIYNTDTNKMEYKFSYDKYLTTSIDIYGNTLISGGLDNSVKITNLKTKKLLDTFRYHKYGINSVSIYKNNAVSGGDDGFLIFYDLKNKKIDKYFNNASILTTSINNKYYALGDNLNSIKFFDIKTHKLISTFKGHKYNVNKIMFYKNLLISGGDDGLIYILNTNNFTIVKKFKDITSITALNMFSNHLLLSGNENGKVILWDLNLDKKLKTFDFNKKITSITISPNKNKIAISTNKTIYFINSFYITKEFDKQFTNSYKVLIKSKSISDIKSFVEKYQNLVILQKHKKLLNNLREYIDYLTTLNDIKIFKNSNTKLYSIYKAHPQFKEIIQDYIYENIKKSPSINKCQKFLNTFKESEYKLDIIKMLFTKIQQKNDIDAYIDFIKKYATTNKQKAIKILFDLIKKKNNIKDYEKFINAFKDSPLAKKAIKQIFILTKKAPLKEKIAYINKYNYKKDEIFNQIDFIYFQKAINAKTIKAYDDYILTFPFSKNVEKIQILAYEKENEYYTDIPSIPILKDIKKDEKQKELLKKIYKIRKLTKDKYLKYGAYKILDRLYKIFETDFKDTSAYYIYLESGIIEKFKIEYNKQKNTKIDKTLKYKIFNKAIKSNIW